MRRIVLGAVLAIGLSTTATAQKISYYPKPNLWPSDSGVIQIPYELRDNRQNIRDALAVAVHRWNATLRIRFYEVSSLPNQTAACARLVIVQNHPKYAAASCGATFGYRGRGNDTNLMLTGGCAISSPLSDLVHELGHVAGLIHEHQRLERDASITLTSLPPKTHYTKFAVDNFVDMAGYTQTHPYAYLSVMHYPLVAPIDVNDADLWTKPYPQSRDLFHFGPGQQAKFNLQHPGIPASVIGNNTNAIDPLDVQALTNLYTMATLNDAKLSDICR